MGPRRRTEQRARGRLHDKLVRDLERLARLAPGGSPKRPIVVDSPAVVDIRAVAKPCPLCEGPLKLEEHAADEIDGTRLRIATVSCTQCGVRRKLYFRVEEAALH